MIKFRVIIIQIDISKNSERESLLRNFKRKEEVHLKWEILVDCKKFQNQVSM